MRKPVFVSLMVLGSVLLAIFVYEVWHAMATTKTYGDLGISLPADKSDYAGQWRANGYDLFIQADGKVHYDKHSGGVRTSVDLPIQEFAGDDFVVGVLFWSTTFHVSAAPHHDDSGWHMTSDGVEYSRP